MIHKLSVFFVSLVIVAAPATAQDVTVEPPSLDKPLIFDSTSRGSSGNKIPGSKFRVVAISGLRYPYALAFLPDGGILVTERAGRLRIVRDGKLDPQPITGIPEVLDNRLRGLNDLALHPRFSENHWIYFTYYKPVAGTTNARATLARARYDGGHALSEVNDIFSTDSVVSGPSAAKIVFGRDGKIYMAIGIPIPRGANDTVSVTMTDAQDPNNYYGKILRLNDDGSAPKDNPFSGRPGHKPELYALGIRNAMGLYVHPETGDIWETENGPQGGDEINIIKAGKNYGWPVISYGRSYSGELAGGTGPSSELPVAAGMEQPWLFFSPSISTAQSRSTSETGFPIGRAIFL